MAVKLELKPLKLINTYHEVHNIQFEFLGQIQTY